MFETSDNGGNWFNGGNDCRCLDEDGGGGGGGVEASIAVCKISEIGGRLIFCEEVEDDDEALLELAEIADEPTPVLEGGQTLGKMFEEGIVWLTNSFNCMTRG